jgi:hypothetical protein
MAVQNRVWPGLESAVFGHHANIQHAYAGGSPVKKGVPP